jgi:hypothetical protein
MDRAIFCLCGILQRAQDTKIILNKIYNTWKDSIIIQTAKILK